MLALEQKTGVKNPRLQSRPQLKTGSKKYMDAYQALAATRQYSQAGIQPIQLSEINAYAELHDVSPGRPRQKLTRMIQAMDETHLNWWAKKQTKNTK